MGVYSQEKYICRNGLITFEASVPSFEEVKARNNNVTTILNTSTGEFASLVLIKGFRFKVPLMEVHFNENYMESDEFPKAYIKGKIKKFLLSKITESEKEFILSGELTIHGKIKQMNIPIKLKMIDNNIYIRSFFSVTPQEFNISIPKIIRKKVAQKVDISVDFELHKKKQLNNLK